MDAMYPRLLVEDFDTAARFWTAALRDLLGVEPVKVILAAGYANWDLNGEAVLALFSRKAVAEAVGTGGLPSAASAASAASAQDAAMLVLRVDDVAAAARCLSGHGASVLADAQDRPDWGPNLRTAHLRTPDGTLVELQSY
ncbi:VOC family protein [Streptomyces sp. P1-3]|uniref:VOC family protein n=1 Tax=Streptomyces sp. P1-3 TaxID=3421658 RepID=UPI003D359D9F